jgi:cysteine synthase
MPTSCQVARSEVELIGSTPVVRLQRIPGAEDAEIWAKLESMNPGGSVKDRICLAMIEAAEREGTLRPGSTIVEPTSGNTGIGLALVAAVKGYRLILTMPDTMSEERRSLLAAYGATLVLTPDTKGMHGAIQRAEEILKEHPDYFMPQQFSNPANPEAHRRTTAREILTQLPAIDAFVAGVGTGGTISGVGRYLKSQNPAVQIIGADPEGSVYSGGDGRPYLVEGIGEDFWPETYDRDLVDRVVPVTDRDSFLTARRVTREEGILIGSGGGSVLRQERRGGRIVAVEPEASPVLSGGEAGYHRIQGIGAGFVPKNFDRSIVDEIVQVSDAEATEMTRRIAREEGILVGVSSGANAAAALRVARALGKGRVVLTIFCDTGERYLTTEVFQAEGI